MDDSLEAFASLKAKDSFAVVGLGGAGTDAVHDMVELGIPGVRALAINTDAKHLLSRPIEERILLGQRVLRGRGSAGDRGRVLDAAEEAKEELVRRLRRYEIVFLIAGLGGGTGSALLPYLVRALRETDALPVPIAFLPFRIELETNPERRDNVLLTLDELEELGGLLLAVSNEKLRRFESLPLHKVFHVRSTYLHNLVTSLVDMVENPSQMNVDLASLKEHLRGAGVSTMLSSEHHVTEPERLVRQAIEESLLDFSLDGPASALVHIDGGSNFTLKSFDRVLHALRGHLGEPRKLIFGTRLHAERRDTVRLTAVVGGLGPHAVREEITRARSRSDPLSGLP